MERQVAEQGFKKKKLSENKQIKQPQAKPIETHAETKQPKETEIKKEEIVIIGYVRQDKKTLSIN